MKLPSAEEALFSVKSFAASMLALYLALRVGLPRPFWAMLTAYVVAQPLSGSVRSKAAYRVGGTILGSAATVLLVPRLSNAPELLSLALASWVDICLYVSLLDRTPRSYLFMLAGYTAALIGFPAVTDPGTIFDVAVARVEEIVLGIVCATLVHSLVFPQSVGPVLLARLDHAVDDARLWLRDALTGADDVEAVRDRRKLAGDITELRLMSTHLPFDTSNLRWTAAAIHALQDRLAIMAPLLSGIADRLRTLRNIDDAALSPRWHALLGDIVDWSHGGEQISSSRAAQLREAIDKLTPAIDCDASWSNMLEVNLAARLHALVDACEQCRNLRSRIDAGLRGNLPVAMQHTGRQPALSASVLHRDYRLALMSSFAAIVAILACCAFWIVTAWPEGSVAAMMAAIFCSFFATQDDPVPGIKLFLVYTVWSIPISAIYLLGVLPAIHSFEMLALAIAPVFLILGIYVARPETSLRAMVILLGVAGTLALQDVGSADLASFLNFMLAQLSGIWAAAVITRLMRSVSAEWTARRLLRAGWAELARLGKADRPPSLTAISARMLDRIGLLTPRLSMAGTQPDLSAIDALGDLRVGLNMAHLLHVQAQLERAGASPRPLLRQLSNHFRDRPLHPASAEPALLDRLDALLRAACAIPPGPAQREAVAALVGIRRDLFPDAPSYQPATRSGEEVR